MIDNPEVVASARLQGSWLTHAWMLMLWLVALSIPARSQPFPPNASASQNPVQQSIGHGPTRADQATIAAVNSSSPLPATIDNELLKLRPQFISAIDLAKALQLAVGNQGSLAVLESQDVVLVAGPPHVLQRATYMMEQVDTPRSQIRLAVYLFDVEVNELKKLELAAAAASKLQTVTVSEETSQFHVLASHADLGQTLKLLSECPGAKLLADPQLSVVDRQSASFDLVTRMPLTHAATIDRGNASGLTSFEEVGVKLTFAPRISSNATVELRVSAQYSSITGFNTQGNPVIDVRSAETTLRANHNQIVVIGGLRKRSAIESFQPNAGLMNRKVVEPLFRSNSAEPVESELICILRTEIVGNQQVSSPELNAQLTALPSAVPGTVANAPKQDGAAVQSGAYQEPLATAGTEQIKPSAYRPSVYNKPSAAASVPRKNINTSRNSVTQPLPLPSKQR